MIQLIRNNLNSNRQLRAGLRCRQEQEARVGGDLIEPLARECLGPAQPLVANLAPDHAGLPARQRHLRAVAFGDVPQLATVERLEAQFVLFVHQTVPVRPFVRSDGPHGHVAQGPNGQAVERGSGRIGRPSL